MKKCILLFLFFITFSVVAQENKTVFFDFDKFNLNETTLLQLNTWVTENKNIEVTKIYGFCDWKGSNNYNDSLSIKRVKTVNDYLKKQNIKVKGNYEVRGFGEDFEQSKVQSENRKVVIVYDKIKETISQITDEENLKDKIKKSKLGDVIKLKNLYFFNMTPRILPKSKPVLYELLCAMEENPNLKVEIQGHICCQLTGDINNLSVNRARAIYNYLITQKINRKRLSFKGFGVTKPIYPIPEKSKEEEDENRRVEILIVEN